MRHDNQWFEGKHSAAGLAPWVALRRSKSHNP